MRLSSLPGRKIMLEIILIADQMGVPEENPEPFIAVVYSHGGALLLGLLMASAVMFGAAFVLPIYRKTKAGTPTNMRIAVLVVLPVVCLVTVLAAYLVNPNKIISHQLNGVPIVLLD